MAELEFTKLSSKGQIVIPHSVREELKLDEGTPFAVMAKKDTILLKKIKMPKLSEWKTLVESLRADLRKTELAKLSNAEILKRLRHSREKIYDEDYA